MQLIIEKCDNDAVDEAQALRELLMTGVDRVILSPPLCDSEAILALHEESGNDDMAAAIVATAHRRQLSVPQDLTVCGFDDTDFAQSIWPELTTVHQPIAEMARGAVTMLVDAIRTRRAGRMVGKHDAVLDFALIRRDSEGPPPAI